MLLYTTRLSTGIMVVDTEIVPLTVLNNFNRSMCDRGNKIDYPFTYLFLVKFIPLDVYTVNAFVM